MIGKRVVVTGASSGLGAHIVSHLVREGARVVAVARRQDRLGQLAEDLEGASGELVVTRTDVTSATDTATMADAAVEAFGGIDALVNNAGMEIQGSIDQLPEADFETMLRTNVIGPYLCIRAVLPHMKSNGGSIVNIGSTIVSRAPRHRFGYVASKGALEGMSRALAGDLGDSGIRVNTIRPGLIPSELRGFTEEEEAKTFSGWAPGLQALNGVGRGADIATSVAFLISDEAAFITGAVLDVDGGYSLGLRK
jgi:NAD(P)-dependent dehydrogenase (short-subunit alcohol dehydrogenase family)